jgi:predicted RNase H-like HicB family nuclease
MNVFVEKHKDGTYWGTVTEVPGVVASYGSTLAELKANVQQAYADYYELAVELKEDYVADLEAQPDFTYLLNLRNIFHLLPEVKVSNIAEKANINPSLLRQYKTGKAEASEEQAKKVLKAIHQLGEELLSVSF